MKKKLLKHFIIVAVIVAAVGLIDLFCCIKFGDSILSISMPGGEHKGHLGILYLYEEFFPLTTIDDPIKYYTKLTFHPFMYIILVAIVTAISMIPIKKKNKDITE